ncbi:pheromone receptor [Diaporthe helianthi]|uniref:Pheromone receptor n=1 Tax=Diaporthe helianthi TaxID=158607 RepID=A0A2P5HMV3_DIAHE|nr:pheromone receptor [Diaporthe helianthi]
MPDPSLNYTALAMQDPLHQNITLTLADGTGMLISLAEIDWNQTYIVGKTIDYAVEFGASLMMLIVLLALAPKSKLLRLASFINLAALINNLVRTILLAIYFESSWTQFYVLYGGDVRFVSQTDFRNSVCSSAFVIPQNLLMMAALMLQAWAMVKMWSRPYKWGILVFSGLLSLAEVAFMLASLSDQIRALYPDYDPSEYLNRRLFLRYVYLGLELASICWFCFIFNLRLVMHMVQNRSFLPSTKGVAAMDMLVMTNGVLMLIPVVLISMQVSQKFVIETGSLVYTSIIIVLPLGTLIAQRLADPNAFNSQGPGKTVNSRNGNGPDYFSSTKKPPVPSWKQYGNTNTVRSAYFDDEGQTGVTSTISSERFPKQGSDAVDRELARIDGDLESGRVRVNRELQQSEEML